MLAAIVFASLEGVHLFITLDEESRSFATADIGESAHSFKACDLPVVGGTTKMVYKLSGISCEPLINVVSIPATNAVVVKRLVAT